MPNRLAILQTPGSMIYRAQVNHLEPTRMYATHDESAQCPRTLMVWEPAGACSMHLVLQLGVQASLCGEVPSAESCCDFNLDSWWGVSTLQWLMRDPHPSLSLSLSLSFSLPRSLSFSPSLSSYLSLYLHVSVSLALAFPPLTSIHPSTQGPPPPLHGL